MNIEINTRKRRSMERRIKQKEHIDAKKKDRDHDLLKDMSPSDVRDYVNKYFKRYSDEQKRFLVAIGMSI